MKNFYGSTSPDISQREIENADLARKAAREGFVLLKNDGALPLRSKRIALYGMGARRTVKGGTGSGAVQERHSVSIAEGLLNAGYEITTQAYLDDYDTLFDSTFKTWHAFVSAKVAGMPIMQAMGVLTNLGGFQWPAGRRISSADISGSATDTAIYVLARQAGEGSDRKLEPGDWYLNEVERANLERITASYANTIVVINVGGQIDLSWMDEIHGINALVFFAQGGMAGGDALADVLSGRHNFCGKLADSWAKRYEDIPFAMDYSHLNGDLENENYREGIYVGYRYFDSFDLAPRYPFGYGLSYTDFDMKVQNVSLAGTKVTAGVKVRNIGSQYAGKSVVQLYLVFPQDELARERQSLVAFVKTCKLDPGSAQDLTLTFDLADAAAYDSDRAAWRLTAGDYVLLAGQSSRDTSPVAVLHLPCSVTTQYCRTNCAPAEPIDEIIASVATKRWPADNLRQIKINPRDFLPVRYSYIEPAWAETEEETRLLDDFSTEEQVSLVIGGDLQLQDASIHSPLGSCGRTSLKLRSHGIGNVVFADGPAGVNLIEHTIFDTAGQERPEKIPDKYNFGEMAERAKLLIGDSNGTHVWRYATAWPVGLLLAQTWDVELMEKIGVAAGRELAEFGVTLWLAPGMNIHRNPLCGRNFEYFSEDPLLSGKMAAAETRGVQSISGVGTTIKHFCCNNQEDNRGGVSSNVSERALREIYLRGFEIAVREAQPMAVMSSYNRLNGVYTANRHDLLTDILRSEWGFKGLVMTDWNSCAPGRGDPAQGVPAGNDLIMPGIDYDHQSILAAVQDGRITMAALRRCAARVLRLALISGIALLNEGFKS